MVDHAQTIQFWRENLPREEMPPRWMWHLDHELEAWFERVEADREAKHERGGGGTSHPDPEGPMMVNALAKQWRGRS